MFAAIKNHLSHDKFQNLRTRGFMLVSVLFILALVGTGSYKFVMAWIIRDPVEQIHLWHVAELAALTILLFAGTLLWLLQRPQEKPLLAQFFVFGIVFLVALFTPFVPQAPGLLLLLGLFIVLYPDFRALLSFSREGRVSKLLFGLSVLAAVVLLPNAWREYQWQIVGWQYGEIHAIDLHWVGSAVLTVLLIVGGFLTSTKRAGWRELGIIVGGIYVYLGVIGMITPEQAGSWGGAGGLFGIIVGVWYIIITVLVSQSADKKAAAPSVEPTATIEAKPAGEMMAVR
jgi:hypothetical protein